MSENKLKTPKKYTYKKVPVDHEDYFRKLGDFSCIDEGLNNFLQGEAIKFHQAGLGITKLVINTENDDIMGYYTIRCNALQYCTSNSEVSYVIKPGEDNSHETYINLYEVKPVIEITRFAIDKKYAHQRVGTTVLSNLILEIIDNIAVELGVTAIFVLSSQDAVGFYENLDFHRFPSDIQKRIKDSETSGCIGLYYNLFDSE